MKQTKRRSRAGLHCIAWFLVAWTWSLPAYGQEDYVIIKSFGSVPPPGPFEGRPIGDMVMGPDGSMYGTDLYHSWKITPEGQHVRLDVLLPSNDAIPGADGFFYNARGMDIVRFTLEGTVDVLFSVANQNTEGSFLNLVQGSDGAFYGINRSIGSNPARIFRMTPTGAITTVYEFPNNSSEITLASGRDGNLYGTTVGFMMNQAYRLTPAGAFTKLHDFGTGSPWTAPVHSDDGLYGTFVPVGTQCGHFYRIRDDGFFEILHSFVPGPTGACVTTATLIEAPNGLFYGTTDTQIFSVTRAGVFRSLHSSGGIPGEAGTARYGWGFSRLMVGRDGNFYGTAEFAGPTGLGVVFRLNAVRSACVNDLQLSWRRYSVGGDLIFVGAIKTETPGFLATWLVTTSGVFPMSSGPVPAITPTLAYSSVVPSLNAGPVGILSLLVTATFDVCPAWSLVDTGVAPALKR